MEISNKFFVGKMGENVTFPRLFKILSEDDAINLAAWIVALTDKEKFEKLYEEIIKT